jgi:hypothetical protein
MPVLASSAYRRLWAAPTVSQWGDIAQFTALSLLVFHLTGSGVGVTGAVIAEIVPVLLLAPVAGPVVDRLPRVSVMIAADLARAVLAAVLAVWHGDIAVVYAAAFGLSAGAVFFNPASGSLALARLGAEPGSALFIHDAPSHVAGAQALGIAGRVHVDTPTTAAAIESFAGVA